MHTSISPSDSKVIFLYLPLLLLFILSSLHLKAATALLPLLQIVAAKPRCSFAPPPGLPTRPGFSQLSLQWPHRLVS